MLRSPRLVAIPFAFLSLAACASTATTRTANHVGYTPGGSVEELAYRLDGLTDDDPRRVPLRDELVARVTDEVDDSATLEPLEQATAAIVRHYRPVELTAGSLPPSFVALADRLLVAATARGDSSDALAALCLLELARPGDPSLQTQRTEIERWVDSARPAIDDEDPSSIGLAFQYAIDDARVLAISLCPSVDALSDAQAVLVDGSRPILERNDLRLRAIKARVRLSLVLSLVAMYASAGDLADAARSLPRDVAPAESDMMDDMLAEALSPGSRGADATLELAESIGRLGREPLEGMLRLGRRAHPRDPRFALSIAHLARERGHALSALAGYADVARLAPTSPIPFEQALRELLEMGESLVADEDPRGLPVIDELVRLRHEHDRRFADRVALLPADRFALVESAAALLAGDAERALAVLRTGDTVATRMVLARGYVELGRTDEALTALDALLADGRTLSPDAELHRGRILRLRGDALRTAGRTSEAVEAYRNARFALRGGDSLGADGAIELALVLARSGSVEEAVPLFETLLADRPTSVDVYVALAEVAITLGLPGELRDEAAERAIVNEALRPEALTLFAALLRLAARPEEPDLPHVRLALERGARLDGFAGAAARFALGRGDEDAVSAAAATPGLRSASEVLFALARRRSGDEAGYLRGLHAAVALGAFREPTHTIARELLADHPVAVDP